MGSGGHDLGPERELLRAGPRQGTQCLRWRGAANDGEERSQAEVSGLSWRGVFAGGGGAVSVKGSEGSGRRWKGAVAGGGERFQVDGTFPGRRNRSQVEKVSGGVERGERSQLEVSGRRRRGAISGGGKRSLVEVMGCKITYIFFNFDKEHY